MGHGGERGIRGQGRWLNQEGAEAGFLGGGEGGVDAFGPVGWARDGAGVEGGSFGGTALRKTAPSPVLSLCHESRAEGITLDVPRDREIMGVVLDGKGLKSALIEVSRSGGLVLGVPPLGMGERKPTHEAREVVVGAGPDDQVEVIGHDAVGEEPNGDSLVGLGQDVYEGVVVASVLKKSEASVRSVQNMVNEAALGGAKLSGHDPSLTNQNRNVN